MTIYVIDDHPLMRDAIVMVLRRMRPAENIVELERLDGSRAPCSSVARPTSSAWT
jgi:DNA-binding NarL/FixJ family response regulator